MTDRTAPADPREALHRDANQLLAAYRVGRRTPDKALDTLDRTRDVPSRLAARQDEPSPALRSDGAQGCNAERA